MDEIVTFITATVGRETLHRAVASVEAQTDRRWRHIVAGDGLRPNVAETNKRTVMKCDHFRHESMVRNWAISCAITDWVAFLDDDDTISPNYVRWLSEEIDTVGPTGVRPEVVIFRQTLPLDLQLADAVIPAKPEIVWGNVGISYAMRRMLASVFPFKPSKHEDLLQLVAVEAAGSAITFSNHLAYYGRDHKG